VLVSWAVPKGIPPDTGHNRLAVQTEDHPLDYADFAGIIPRGEYGGGTVTIWDAGTYVTEKWRDGEVIIVLDGQKAKGRYALIRTKDNSWLLHRMKDQGAEVPWVKKYPAERQQPPEPAPARAQPPAPPTDLKPMLATAGSAADISNDADWRFEGKWDGIRALATLGPGGLKLHSRAGNDFTHSYPELQVLVDLLDGHSGVLDGEIVALDEKGKTSFSLLQQRMNLAAARDVARVRKDVPVQFWLFDVLHLDGVSLLRKRYDVRRQVLEALPISGDVCLVPDQLTGSVADALQGSVDLQWEGIVAKRLDSTYLPGKRSHSWIKIKNFRDLEVVVVGWKPGAGRREGSLGSLLLAVPDADRNLRYAGKVGTGFTDTILDQLMTALEPLRSKTSAVADSVPRADALGAVWVRPELVGEIKYGEWTPDRRLRATSWRGLRPDKSPDDLESNLLPER
jgi:bifunctional non-homologous end joining protein LigD